MGWGILSGTILRGAEADGFSSYEYCHMYCLRLPPPIFVFIVFFNLHLALIDLCYRNTYKHKFYYVIDIYIV